MEIKHATEDQWVREELKKKNLKWKNISKFVGCSKRISKRRNYSNKCLPQETRKVSNNLISYLKE